jgi:DNA-binding GntR family transcriptional regulator
MLSYIDDRPYALMSIFMPQNISDLIGREMLSSKTFLEAYEEVVGDKIATIHRSISAVIPDDEQCDLLGAQPGSAHLWMKNIALREDESPVAMNYAIYNGNVYDFAVELELNSPSFF